MINSIEYTVAICMITYNHELFIGQAIDSVLMQNTDFSYHLYIGEDCSTDQTRSICIEYATKYPNKITLLSADSNLGMEKNFNRTMAACSAKYIAFCEGDDYWTDPYKLQKQVDFLESNPDYGLIHTAHDIYVQDTNVLEHLIQEKNTGHIFKKLLFENEMATLTVMVRKSLINRAMDEKYSEGHFVSLDYPLWLHVASYSKVYYLNDVTAVYRKLSESASNTKNELKAYRFIIGITDIKITIAKKFGCLDLILDYVSEYKKRNLKYAYLTGNEDISIQAYDFLFEHNKLTLKDRMFYYCTMFYPLRLLAKVATKIKNK